MVQNYVRKPCWRLKTVKALPRRTLHRKKDRVDWRQLVREVVADLHCWLTKWVDGLESVTFFLVQTLTAKGYPWDVRRISWRDVRISHNSPHMSLDITLTSQGHRHFRHTGYNPVGLKYPAQDIRVYNEINNDSKIKNLSYY